MRCVVKRNEVYYLRLRVPSDVRKFFYCGEVVQSLHTRRYREAKSLARGKLGELEKIFMVIRSGVLSDDDIAKLVEKYKREQLSQADEFMDNLAAAHSDFKATRSMLSEHYSTELEAAKDVLLDQRGMDEMTTFIASRLLGEQGRDGVYPDMYDRPGFMQLCRSVALTQKEILETLIQRNETGDSDYDRQERAKPKSKTLSELITIYQREKAATWKDGASTRAIHSRILHILGDVRLDEVDREVCLSFRDALTEYPLKNADFTTPWQTLSKRKKTRLGERTQNGTITELITLFDYANTNDMGIRGNPAKGLSKSKEECKRVKVRKPFTVEEMQRMVDALVQVNRLKKPETFWIPLLLLFTGARANEICMLRCDDVVMEGGIWFLHFRNIEELEQRTKSGKNRQVPVHSQLLKLGFVEFCDKQKGGGHDRLFPSLKLREGKWNVDFGKQFARTFKRKFLQGYTDEELSAKDLHSFRMTFISWFVKSGRVNNAADITMLQSIVGHTDVEELKFVQEFMQKTRLTVEGYGGGFNLEQKVFIEQMDYGVDFSALEP